MDVGAYAFPLSTFMRKTPMLIKSCVLWQLVMQNVAVFVIEVWVKHRTLNQEPVWGRKYLSFSKFFLALLMLG